MEIRDLLHLWKHEHLGVGCPKNNDLVYLLFHILDVLSDLVDAFLVCSFEDIVNSVGLVGSDKVRVEDGRKWLDLLQVVFQGIDESWLQDMRSLASCVKISRVNVPTRNDKVGRVNHWHEIFDWLVDILEIVGSWIHLETNMGGGALGERTMEVWLLHSFLGFPSLVLFVG